MDQHDDNPKRFSRARLGHWLRRLASAVTKGRTGPWEDNGEERLVITAKREVVYDDGWTRIYGPSVESGGWCEIEFLRIPWVEEAKAKAAAADRAAEQAAKRVSPEPVAAVAVASKPARPPRVVEVQPSQVRAGDGAMLCAADILGQACRCGAHHRLASHGPVGDDLGAFCCPDCFSCQ